MDLVPPLSLPTSPHALKLLQLILSIERTSLTTDEKEYSAFFQSTGELIRDFFGAQRIAVFVYITDEDRLVDGWSPTPLNHKEELERAQAWGTLYIQQPNTTYIRQWKHQTVEDQARQLRVIPEHLALVIPLLENKPAHGFIVIEEPSHPLIDDPLLSPLLSTLAMMVFSIIQRLQTGVIAQSNLAPDDQINYRIAQFSHQIRTPLMGLQNAMQLISSRPLDDAQKEYFDIAWNSTRSMQLMLDRILDIAKVDSSRTSPDQTFDLETELLVIIKNQMIAAQEKGLSLHLEFASPLNHQVVGDNVILHHVLLNLISNAIKYTTTGSVTVRVTPKRLNREKVKLAFDVIDTGMGIPKEFLSQLFKPYFRIHDLYSQVTSGTGLGLPVVQDILRRVKSKLEIETEEGRGSTFSFTLSMGIHEQPSLYDFKQLNGKKACVFHKDDQASIPLMNRLQHLGLSVTTKAFDEVKHSDRKTRISPTADYIILDGPSAWCYEQLQELDLQFHDSVSVLGYRSCYEIESLQRTKPALTWLSATQSRLEWRDILLRSEVSPKQVITPKRSPILHPWRVMLIDDNPINLKTLEALLSQVGLDVTIAADSVQGLRIVASEPFDFILLDIKMPELSGPEVLQRIRLMRHSNATIPIFAATAYAFDKEQHEFLSMGFNEVVTKPVDINRLLRLMMRYKEVHFDEVIAPEWGVPSQQITFNEDEFNHHYEGLDSLKSEVMQLFFEQSEGSLRRIQAAIEEMNFEKIAFEAHYYKGSCSYLSAPRITWLCTKLIEFAKRKEADTIPNLMAQLIQETTLFNYRIRDYLGHQGLLDGRPLQSTSSRPSHHS